MSRALLSSVKAKTTTAQRKAKAEPKAPPVPLKGPGGRPEKYRPEFAEQAAKLCRLYATNIDMADFFGVSERTLDSWKFTHPEFGAAVKRTKDEVDQLVVHSLARRALGYSHAEEVVFQYQGEVVRAQTRKQYPPDTAACIFWLKNRQSEQWRQNPEPADGDDSPAPTRVEVVVVDGRKHA